MLRIKKLDIFIVKSFLLLFVGTFFICLFIFMMQFLWRYVDDLVGKGLEMSVMAEFFMYSAMSLVPAALPLAILLASLITFGNFGERFELLAMKAAGIPLIKIMRPLIILVSVICCVSFYFQNVIGPAAQQKLGTLLISVKQKSPELDIPEGAFYSEIPDYNLRVMHKNRETGMMYDVLIYNLQDGADNAHIIYADSAKMEMTADKQHLNLHLYKGELFENLRNQSVMKSENVPYRRESFKEKHTIIEFDSDFNMADASVMSNQATTKGMDVLQHSIDSMTLVGDSIGRVYFDDLKRSTYSLTSVLSRDDSTKYMGNRAKRYDVDSIFNTSSLQQKKRILQAASNRAESLHNDIEFKKYTMDGNDYQIRRHKIEWHKKFTISLSCLLFFFIGAPLGGIIRKGGLGMPVIISVMVFIIYYVIDNSGYKLARDGRWIVWMGEWLSSAVLAPVGAWLTYKSNKDSMVLNVDAYVHWFKKVAGIRDVRGMLRKEVVIVDPDYTTAPARLDDLTATCMAYAEKNRLKRAPNYFRLWFHTGHDEDIIVLHEKLESLIEELGNTRSAKLINVLNNYPIISTTAHLRPFQKSYWLNVAAAIVLPVGLFFYFRIWMFRVRLAKDMKRIAENNVRAAEIIEEDFGARN
jgi:lipopolysaccharide export system permease protein